MTKFDLMQARQLQQSRPARQPREANALLGRSEHLLNPQMGSRRQALRQWHPWWRAFVCCCSSSPRCAATTRWAQPSCRCGPPTIQVAAGRCLPTQPGSFSTFQSTSTCNGAVLVAAQRRPSGSFNRLSLPQEHSSAQRRGGLRQPQRLVTALLRLQLDPAGRALSIELRVRLNAQLLLDESRRQMWLA